MTNRATTYRLPVITIQQIESLSEKLGATYTQIVVLAIDRMAREEAETTSKRAAAKPISA